MKLFNTYQEFIANQWVIVLFGLISGVGYVLDLFLVEFTSAIVMMHSVCAGISFTALIYFLITKKHNWELLKILTLTLFLNLLVLPFLALTLDNFILLFYVTHCFTGLPWRCLHYYLARVNSCIAPCYLEFSSF